MREGRTRQRPGRVFVAPVNNRNRQTASALSSLRLDSPRGRVLSNDEVIAEHLLNCEGRTVICNGGNPLHCRNRESATQVFIGPTLSLLRFTGFEDAFVTNDSRSQRFNCDRPAIILIIVREITVQFLCDSSRRSVMATMYRRHYFPHDAKSF
jgi:hypothetical protein